MQQSQRRLQDLLDAMVAERARLADEARVFDALATSLSDLREDLRAGKGQVVTEPRTAEIEEHLATARRWVLDARASRVDGWVASVESMVPELERVVSLAALGELSASVAHEIRNPLCGIQLLVEVLQTKMDAEDSRHAILENLRRETERMGKVVTNLLHFSRRYEPQRSLCAIEDVVRRSIDSVQSHLTKGDVTVVVGADEAGCEAEVDGDLLMQVFKNLLLNAVEASPAGSTLRVQLQPADDGRAVAVAFADQGEGIGEDAIRKVFDPFFTSKPNGIGLGLSVSKKIVDAHNGRIQVESMPGQGATFTVLLPCRADEGEQRLAA